MHQTVRFNNYEEIEEKKRIYVIILIMSLNSLKETFTYLKDEE